MNMRHLHESSAVENINSSVTIQSPAFITDDTLKSLQRTMYQALFTSFRKILFITIRNGYHKSCCKTRPKEYVIGFRITGIQEFFLHSLLQMLNLSF